MDQKKVEMLKRLVAKSQLNADCCGTTPKCKGGKSISAK